MSVLLLLKTLLSMLANAGTSIAHVIDTLIPERTREKVFRYGMAAFAGWVLCYAHYDVKGLRAAAAQWDHARFDLFAAKDAELARYKTSQAAAASADAHNATLKTAREASSAALLQKVSYETDDHSCSRSPVMRAYLDGLRAIPRALPRD